VTELRKTSLHCWTDVSNVFVCLLYKLLLIQACELAEVSQFLSAQVRTKDMYCSRFKGFLTSGVSFWTSMCWHTRLYSCVRHNSLVLCSQNCPSTSSKMKDSGDMSVAYFCFEHVTIADLLDALWECPHQYNCWNSSVNGLRSVIKNLLLSVD
jgi:hypothetical protein